MMADFEELGVALTPGVTIHGRCGGRGPAIVLLHGHPPARMTCIG